MLKYIIQDFTAIARFIPYGIIIGLSFGIVGQMINNRRQKHGKEKLRIMAPVCFLSYMALTIIITFLSREGGEQLGMDLEIGSTLKINTRNDAYVVENVLLFVPFGFCLLWFRRCKGFFFYSLIMGFVTSLCIEVMQLVTGRGLFQVDDIITNTLGCVIGAFFYKCIEVFCRKLKR